MNKKVCLNLLLSSNNQDPVSLADLTPLEDFSKNLNVQPISEIFGICYEDLEKRALKTEADDIVSAYNLWLKSIALKISHYKTVANRVFFI
jgi:hypothetical protein